MTTLQKLFITISIFIVALTITFNDVVTGEKVFATPDSQSAAAVGKGMEMYKGETGEYPKWNPWIFSGVPAAHSLQHVSRFYPPHIIFKELNNIGLPKFSNYLIHFLFMGMGCFLILYRRNVNLFACIYTGLAFTIMPYLITMIVHGHGSQMMTSAYIPWIFLFLEKLRNKTNLKNLSILALLIGFQLLRGHVQIAYYTWLIIGSYSLFHLVNDFKNKQFNSYKNYYLFLFISLLIGFASSVQLYYPAHSYSPFSIRGGTGGGTGLEYATAWSFSFGEMLTFFNPNFYGFGGSTYWGNMPFTDYPNYMSILSILFMLFAVIFVKNNLTKILLFIWISSLLLSFGHNTPIYKFFYNYFPFFNKFRVPAMFLIILQFSTVLLAGLGINEVLKNKIKDFKNYLPFIISFGILILSKLLSNSMISDSAKSHPILNPTRLEMINDGFMFSFIILIMVLIMKILFEKNILKKQLFGIALIGLLFSDLYRVNEKIIQPNDKYSKKQLLMSKKDFNKLHKDDEIVKYLKLDNSNFRILPLGNLLTDNKWAGFQIENVGGYHPAKLQNYQSMMSEVSFNSPGFLQMLNVKYLISLNELNHPLFKNVFSGKLNFQGQNLNAIVYKSNLGNNGLFIPKDIKNYQTKTELIESIKNPYFSPFNTLLLSKELNISEGENGNGEIIEYKKSPDKISAKIQMEEPGFIVFSEVFYPNGWFCKINNEYAEIYEANGLLRALKLDSGLNEIEMYFEPEDLKIGKVISNIAFIILFLGIVLGIIQERKNKFA